GLARAGHEEVINLTDLKDFVEIKVPQYSRELKACHVERQQEYCQKPVVPLTADNYALVPRFPAILGRLCAGEPQISRTPTHVVGVAAADLMDTATRGSEVKRRLQAGTLVTVIKAEGDWAYIAKDGNVLGYILQNQLAPVN